MRWRGVTHLFCIVSSFWAAGCSAPDAPEDTAEAVTALSCASSVECEDGDGCTADVCAGEVCRHLDTCSPDDESAFAPDQSEFTTTECHATASSTARLACAVGHQPTAYVYQCPSDEGMPPPCSKPDGAHTVWCCAEEQIAERSKVLATGSGIPRFARTHGTLIQWFDHASGDMRAMPHDGGAIITVGAAVAPTFHQVAWAGDRAWVGTAGSAGRLRLVGANGAILLDFSAPFLRALAADGDHVLWTDGTEVRRNATEVLYGAHTNVKAIALDPVIGEVYWWDASASGNSGTLWRGFDDGSGQGPVLGGPTANRTGLFPVPSLRVLLAASDVGVSSIDTTSGTSTAVSTTGGEFVAADDGIVVWTASDGVYARGVNGIRKRLAAESSVSGVTIESGTVTWSTWTGRIGRVRML